MTDKRKIYFNGEFVDELDARVSIFDSALMFGDMVFEMTRSFKHEPFKLREHLERLYVGLKILEIDPLMTIDQMEDLTKQVVEKNLPTFKPGIDFNIMHSVSRGPLGPYRSLFPDGLKPTIYINCWPLYWHVGALSHLYDTGVNAIITSQRSVPAQYIDPKMKNRSRIYYQIANMQAHKFGDDAWALLTDDDGFITEGTGANFFIVKNGELITPEPRNILRGVTRETIINLAEKLGIKCHEKNIEAYDVVASDEAFFSSTPFVLMPATKINGLTIGNGKVGDVTKLILKEFSKMVDVDIVDQAKKMRPLK